MVRRTDEEIAKNNKRKEEREEAKRKAHAKEQEEKARSNRKEKRLVTYQREGVCPERLDACYEILKVPLGPNRRPLDATAVKRCLKQIFREYHPDRNTIHILRFFLPLCC